MSDSVRPLRCQPTRLPHCWDSPGKNTDVGCHFFLQCMKVKIESEVAQSCPTLHDPRDCSLPGSSVHGIFQARVVEWGAIAFSLVLLSSSQTLSSRRTALQRGFSSSGLLAFWARSLLCCLVFSLSCDPMDCSPPGSSVPGLSQARILKGSSQPRD